MLSVANELREVIRLALNDFSAIRTKEWLAKPRQDKWSKLEILGHLVDSAINNTRRFVEVQYLPNQKLIYHQNEWVAITKHQNANIQAHLNLWKSLNLHIARIIEAIPEENLTKVYDTGKGDINWCDLEYLIKDYVKHTKHHLNQIIPEKGRKTISLNGKIFRSISNTANGEVGNEVLFHYAQKNEIVWANYEGGKIKQGILFGRMTSDDTLEFEYRHYNNSDELMTGKCLSKIQITNNGKLQLLEKWQWTCKDYSKGQSVIEEV